MLRITQIERTSQQIERKQSHEIKILRGSAMSMSTSEEEKISL
jgi:hypothetical protein